jgi:hypothetical protein
MPCKHSFSDQHKLQLATARAFAVPAPRSLDLRTARRLHAAFVKQGRKSPWDHESASGDSGEPEPFSLEQPGPFACYQAAAPGIAVSGERTGQPVLRVAFGGASSHAYHQ